MTDVLLSSDNLTVLGGPSRISLAVDIGPTGERGSKIFVGNGNPNIINIGQTPKIFDLYINLLTSDPEEYLNFYQYVIADGVESWSTLFNLRPGSKSTKVSPNFVDGTATVYIPVSSIVPTELINSVTASNFNIQHSIQNANPLASSITVGAPEINDDVLSLPITIKAVEAIDSEESAPLSDYIWEPLDGTKVIDLFITMV
jgi:hypothetical protein